MKAVKHISQNVSKPDASENKKVLYGRLSTNLREDNIMLVKVNVQFKKGTTRSRIRFQIFRFKFFFHELAPGCNFYNLLIGI